MSPEYRESPASRDLANEITAINLSFFALLTHPAVGRHAPLLGLDANVLNPLRGLSESQLGVLARTPVVLAGFGNLPGNSHMAVTQIHGVAEDGVPVEWSEHAQRFANRLLMSLWHHSRQDDGLTGFCVGLDRAAVRWLAALSFSELSERADDVCSSLQARHAGHPVCWPDLMAFARTGQQDKLAAAQLSLVPLGVAGNCAAQT